MNTHAGINRPFSALPPSQRFGFSLGPLPAECRGLSACLCWATTDCMCVVCSSVCNGVNRASESCLAAPLWAGQRPWCWGGSPARMAASWWLHRHRVIRPRRDVGVFLQTRWHRRETSQPFARLLCRRLCLEDGAFSLYVQSREFSVP